MARILIVEDDPSTVIAIRRNLQRFWPLAPEDLQIDTAVTVTEAHVWLDQAFRQKQPYDVVILDFKLPGRFPGDHTEVDESLCFAVCRLFPKALVGHITSNLEDDPQVREHIQRMHVERVGIQGFSLSKNDYYLPALLANVKQHLFAKPIEKRLTRLFSDTPQDFSANETECLANQLADLKREIMLHWEDLEDSLKERIRKAYKYVETDETGRLVNLSQL